MENKEKKFLVTGGAGFIGSHLSEKLISLGSKVVCLDNLSTGRMENLSEIKNNPNFKFIKVDVNKFEQIQPVFEQNQFDGVFHYAAIVGVKRTLENPLLVLEDIEGIKNVLKLALEYGRPKIVFSSSSEVYGEPKEIPEREDGVINPQMPYAVVKLMGEKLLESYYQKYNLKTCSLRFFNVYGPRQESGGYGFVVGMFIRKVLKGEPPEVFGDGSQTRDFTYIDDNIEASLRAMEIDTANGQVINIGTGRPLTIFDLSQKIIDLVAPGKGFEPKLVESKRDDVKHRFPEVGRMIKLLNFHPKVSLEDGLKKTIGWHKKQWK